MTGTILIYGATGYTGELISREAARRGLAPILAGRSPEKVAALARRLSRETGTQLQHRTFDVEDAAAHLADTDVLLNCAGPFQRTAPAMVEACLGTGTHYVDITGEIGVLAHCHERDGRAREKGVVLLPGAGFDVVPTDSLAAAVASHLPDATELDIAFDGVGTASIGTITTMVENLGAGGMIRRGGELQSVPLAYRTRQIPFPGRTGLGVTIPWGDVFTSGVSTGVPNGMVYMGTSPRAVRLQKVMRLVGPLVGSDIVQRVLLALVQRFLPAGADSEELRTRRARIWAEARNAAGERVVGTMTTPHPYALT
ncbi:MAG: saccharopine dehydrogenase NADP-binding domain-containing protein, partial [Brachybacterium sp.]|nr:saccharopine dehydrogenase NADP-binding domain-containing protein [Brachybacterium sp.]